MNGAAISYTDEEGVKTEAHYLPQHGMNLASFKKGGREVIAQSTKEEFERRYAGLGALIGPHFHRRRPEVIPPVPNEGAFPHIAYLKSKGGPYDPFSHGIGRYAPWSFETEPNRIRATLKGEDLWNEVPLKELEGQDFTMEYEGTLTAKGLRIRLSVVSESDSIVGIHHYFSLPEKRGVVKSRVQKECIVQGKKEPIPEEWGFNPEEQSLAYALERDTDFTFHPYPDPLEGEILLDAEEYALKIGYRCDSQENGWQLYHPQDAPFVCVEPVSSQDPRHPNLTVSSLDIRLEII